MRRQRKRTVSEEAWAGYLRNVGVYTGNRAICDGRGTVLADFPTRVDVQHFEDSDGDEFLLWTNMVRTVDGSDQVEEEWSRDELAELGALVADGSFSSGPNTYVGERFVIEQCLCDGPLRVRSISAFDWEGRMCGMIASREKRVVEGEGDGAGEGLTTIEPAAWKSPSVLLDYMLGVWNGKGVLIDRMSGNTRRVTSEVTLTQTDGLAIVQKSGLALDGVGTGMRVESRARRDGNVLFFAESSVQLVLLPGGMSVASPLRVRESQPFVLETSFLMRPDCRKRVVRTYNPDCEWINTVFLFEKRVG
jgi:hypothetical protein